MVQPINYTLDVNDPFQKAIQGLDFGTNLREREQAMQVIAAQEGRNVDQAGRDATMFGQEQAAMQQQQARANQMQSDLFNLSRNPDAGADEYARIASQYPEISDEITQNWELIDTARQQGVLQTTAQAYSAISSGQNDIARGILQDQLDAAINSNDQETAQQAELMLAIFDADPEAAKASLGMALSVIGGDQFSSILSNGRAQVRSSEILSDGTTIQSTDDGTRVISPTGEELQGEARAAAIRQAQEFGAQTRQLNAAGTTAGKLTTEADLGAAAAGAVEAGRSAIQIGREMFERIPAIRTQISNLNQGIEAIDNGANTGVLQRMLPSINQATIELDNVASRLGLDVISSVAFGALSESELDVAMQTALPDRLEGPALRDWLVRKRDAQEKLADHLQEAAQFLSTPGNTVANWLQQGQRPQSTQSTPSTPSAPADFSSEIDTLLRGLGGQ